MLQKNQQTFLKLLSTAIWAKEPSLQPKIGEDEEIVWSDMFEIGDQQAIQHIIFDAIEQVPVPVRPSFDKILQWAALVMKHERVYEIYVSKLKTMLEEYGKRNIPIIPIKGLTYAHYYPKPKHRNIGDIDLFIDNSYRPASQQLMKDLGAEGDDDELVIRHDSYKYDGQFWEIHIRTMEFHNPKADKIYDAFEKEYAQPDKLIKREIEGMTVNTFSPIFDIIYNTVHIQRHLILEFVTMRQICDWTLLLYNEKEIIKANLSLIEEKLRKLGLYKTFKSIAYIAVKYLGLPAEYSDLTTFTSKEEKHGEFLLNCIMEGHVPGCKPYEERYVNDTYIKKARLFGEHLLQSIKLSPICGKESLYAPIVTIRNFIARRS